MVKYNNTDIPRIMRGMTQDLDSPFIKPKEVQEALRVLSEIQFGFRDENDPRCLLATESTLESGFFGNRRSPVNCGEDASAKTHSITRGRLSRIAKATKGGDMVLQHMPDVQQLVALTKGEAGYPGSQGLWEIGQVPPHYIDITVASVGHSVCAYHDRDRDFFGLVDDLDLSSICDYQRIVSANHGLEFSLFILAYRTLLFCISQLRGVEIEVTCKRAEQVKAGNRYAVDVLDSILRYSSNIIRSFYRDKLLYDRRLVDSERVGFVHHVMPFNPHVRFAAAEYHTLPCNCHADTATPYDFYASVNILPGDNRSWLVVTYPNVRCIYKYYDSIVSNWVRDFCSVNDVGKKLHLKAMGNWKNLYSSPEDYFQLDERDRMLVEEKVAHNVCRDPCRQHIDVLLASPCGPDFVKNWLRE